MVQKQQIILDYFKKGLSIREISRQTNLHRKTISSHIEKYKRETGCSLVSCEGVIHPPKYDSSARKPRKLTSEIKTVLQGFIQSNEEKINNRKRKQCMCATDMHEELLKRGFDIGYTTVSQFVKSETQRRKEMFIKQHHLPAQSAEFDWGEVKLCIDGEWVKVFLAVFSLPFSNRRWAYLFWRQDMSSFLMAHVLFFIQIGGVPLRIVYDNMKTAVAKFSYRNHLKRPTEDLLKISTYYLFTPRFCNAYKGNEKGHVEKSVEFVRRRSFCLIDHFDSLEHANTHLAAEIKKINERKSDGHELTNLLRFETEQKQLTALPPAPYDFAISQTYKISKYSSIQVKNNHYSVPDFSPFSTVNVKVYPNKIRIYDLKGQFLAQHQRLLGKNKWSLTLEHYRLTLMRKPGAVTNSLALNQASSIVRDLFHSHFKDQPVEFLKMLNYLTEKSMSFDAIGPIIKSILNKAPHIQLSFDYIKCQLERTHQHSDPSKSDQNNKCQLSHSILNLCGQQLNDFQKLF